MAAEPFGSKFRVGPDMTPWEGLWMIEILKICLQQKSIFITFLKSTIFFIICDFFCFTMYTKRKCSQLKQKQALFLLKYTLNTIHRIETEASLVLLKYTLNAIRRMKKKQA